MTNIIAVDIGNSSITLGLFQGTELMVKKRLETLVSATGEYSDRIKDFLSVLSNERNDKARVDGIIICSVVPELTGTLSSAFTMVTGIKPRILGQTIDSGLSFDVTKPYEVGPDRIANAVATRWIYGDPAIIIDFGTATTLSIIKDNSFIGGAIMPGPGTMAKALNKYTSRLPLVDLNSLDWSASIPALGKDTRKNIISGIIYGSAGAVEHITKEIESEVGCRFLTVLTGGFSVIMARFLERDFFLDPDLTLKGLRLIYERNDYA